MDKNTARELCSVIVDRLARNKVWGFPFLQYPGGRKGDRLKLEAERLTFVDCQTIDIQELQKILQSYDEKKKLPSVDHFREMVLLYPDERGEKKARAYEPGKIGSIYPGVRFGQDQASMHFRYYLLCPPDQMFRSVAPYFKEGDKAQEVAQKLHKTVTEVIQDKMYFIEKGKDATERPGTGQAKSNSDPIVATRNSVICEWYGKAQHGRKAKITAEKLDKSPGMENDPLLKKWVQLSYSGALKTESTYRRVKSLFSTIYKRNKD